MKPLSGKPRIYFNQEWNMLKLPYGISYFETLVSENYHFIDRTPFLEKLENQPERYLVFLRPRRFGKSLWISILHHYYGLEYKDRFEALFGKYWIGQHPTPRANSYHILRFEFSRINTDTPESTKEGFLFNVKQGIVHFEHQYGIPHQSFDDVSEPAHVLHEFLSMHGDKKIYLLIDEYDHFANEILGFRFDHFSDMVSRNGFVRKFYEAIKEATGRGIVDRLFITGVSPITMDSLTSGFNIIKQLTLHKNFHNMLGFTEPEVQTILQGVGCSEAQLPQVMEDMKKWYNGYRFEPDSQRLYNPDMVLYFANEYLVECQYPRVMLDVNIASDYGKLRRLFDLKNQAQNYDVLYRLIQDGFVSAELTQQFSFEKRFNDQDFISLLFYLGLISIDQLLGNALQFKIPNYVMEGLYLKFFAEVLETQTGVEHQILKIHDAMLKMAYDNQPEPFLKLIEAELMALSNRDFIKFDEKYVQLLFVTFCRLSDLYFVKSQPEVTQKYPDVLLLHRPPFFPTCQFLFEFKYLKKASKAKQEQVLKDTEIQVQTYLQNEEIRQISNLKSYVVLFVGAKLKALKEQ
ncbi:MAG: AAA family ATPase [SAR324 cluster bacterium]|nr:AAA family ATPase [SAR324 cluster bacterium]